MYQEYYESQTDDTKDTNYDSNDEINKSKLKSHQRVQNATEEGQNFKTEF